MGTYKYYAVSFTYTKYLWKIVNYYDYYENSLISTGGFHTRLYVMNTALLKMWIVNAARLRTFDTY